MLLRCFNYLEIIQQPTARYPARGKAISLTFLNSYEVVTTWDAQTDTARISFPKNVTAKDLEGNDITLQNLTTDIGNGDNPLFLRGDRISLQAGYWYPDSLGVEQQYVKLLFGGYITKVFSKRSITLECEDSMYLLKQCPAPDRLWSSGQSVADIITECLAGSAFAAGGGVVKTQSQNATNPGIGSFYSKGETVAQLLGRIKKELYIGSYIKGNELRIGYPTYWPEDVQNVTAPFQANTAPFQFTFQKNIIADNLQYMRTDDIVVSATAQTFYNGDDGETTDGQPRTRKKKPLVFVYADPAAQSLQSRVITDISQPIPEGPAQA